MGSPREEEQKKVTFAPAQISDTKLEKMNLMTERLDKLEATRQPVAKLSLLGLSRKLRAARAPRQQQETDQIEALASQIEEINIFMMQSARQYRPYRDDYRVTSPTFQGRQSRNRYRDDRRRNFSRRSRQVPVTRRITSLREQQSTTGSRQQRPSRTQERLRRKQSEPPRRSRQLRR